MFVHQHSTQPCPPPRHTMMVYVSSCEARTHSPSAVTLMLCGSARTPQNISLSLLQLLLPSITHGAVADYESHCIHPHQGLSNSPTRSSPAPFTACSTYLGSSPEHAQDCIICCLLQVIIVYYSMFLIFHHNLVNLLMLICLVFSLLFILFVLFLSLISISFPFFFFDATHRYESLA